MVQIKIRTLVISVFFATLFGMAVGGGAMLLFTQSDVPQTAPAVQQETEVTPTQTPAPVVQSSEEAYAAELVSGSEGDEWDRTYHCKAGYETVRVPIGQTVQQSGATFILKEQRGNSSKEQESVTFTVTLPPTAGAPTMFINTAAHNLAPTLYPQHLVQLALQPGATGEYLLRTRSYTENYYSGGITDVTICLTTP